MNFQRHHLKLKENSPFLTRGRLLILEQPQDDSEVPQEPAENPETADDNAPAPDEPAENPPVEEPSDETLVIKIEAAPEIPDEFRMAVKTAITTIPSEVRKIVADAGYSIVLTKLVGEVVTKSKDPLVSWDRLSTAVVDNGKKIVVADSVKDMNDKEIPTLNPAGLVRHALGHAIDSLAPNFVKNHMHNRFSDLESFKYAHVSDVGRLAQDKKQKLAFYVEDADASRSECFAECFAALHDGGSTYTVDVMTKYFPAVMKQVKDTISAIQSGTEIQDKNNNGVPDNPNAKIDRNDTVQSDQGEQQ